MNKDGIKIVSFVLK